MSLRIVAWTTILLASIVVHSGAARAENAPMLVDQRGHAFSLESLRGSPVVLTFVSAHCHDACPLINAEFSNAAQRSRERFGAARYVTITLDPERDTRADMARIAAQFSADPRTWLLASGRPGEVHRVMQRFGVKTERDTDGFASAHGTFVYLLDARGRLEKTLLPSTDLATQLKDQGAIP